MPSPLPTIDPAQLDAVTGGATKDDRILDKIQSLAGAVSDVAIRQQENQKPDAAAALMPIVAMKMMQRRT